MVATYKPHSFIAVVTETQVDEVVYVLNSRTNTYKQIAHRIRRISNGVAFTYCTIVCRDKVVGTNSEDCFIWCENGCKPVQKEATS